MNGVFRIVIAGDLMPSGKNLPFFEEGRVDEVFDEGILSLFQKADFAIANLEGPLTSSAMKQRKTGPVIKASEKCVNGIKQLGIDAVMLANNHITDYQKEGVADTIRLLEGSGIAYIGAGENEKSIKRSLSLNLGEKRICIYNVSETFYNRASSVLPGANLYDDYLVCNEIRELKKAHDYLIVVYHGGAEEFPYPTPLLQQRFHRMADCGADFITAQHTHCIGSFERYNKAYLLYGQGNFLFTRMQNSVAREGLVTELVFTGELVDIHHHLVRATAEDTLVYDRGQDLSAFHRRSREIQNQDDLVQKYYFFCYSKHIIKDRHLDDFHGDSIVMRILKKMPGGYFKRFVLEKYNKEQMMRMQKCFESERYAENMFACMQYMLDRK